MERIWPLPGKDHAHLLGDPHLGIPLVLPNAEAIREVGNPQYDRIWRGKSLSREENLSNMALGYYMNKFMACGFSSGVYTATECLTLEQ